MAATAPIYADRGHGRSHTTADRRHPTSDLHRGRLIPGHLNLHRNFHHVDGRDRPERKRSGAGAPTRPFAARAECSDTQYSRVGSNRAANATGSLYAAGRTRHSSTPRRDVVRGRLPGLGGGSSGVKIAHCALFRSVQKQLIPPLVVVEQRAYQLDKSDLSDTS